MSKKIVIIGAGINGLVLAISLRQLGFAAEDIEIYEKSALARSGGSGIIFWAEAVSILKLIGIDLTDVGVCLPKLKSFFLKEFEIPFTVDIEKAAGQEAYGFLRENIYNRLLDKAKSYGLKVNTGFDCLKVEEQKNGCAVTFQGKAKPVFAEVVIGCDGINSTVRNNIAPTVKPVPLNIRGYRGTYIASKADITKLDLPTDTVNIYCGANSRIILYPNFVDSKAETTSYYWFVGHRIDPAELTESVVTTSEIEELIKRMSRCPENLKTLFRTTPLQDIIPNPTLRQLPFATYTHKRIALHGDAAHAMAPTAGLGFLLGVINVLYLAGNLKLHSDNIPMALSKYNEGIAYHSKACLNYTDKLTKLFYVASPMSTAKDAKEIYATMYRLIAEAEAKGTDFYKEVMEKKSSLDFRAQIEMS